MNEKLFAALPVLPSAGAFAAKQRTPDEVLADEGIKARALERVLSGLKGEDLPDRDLGLDELCSFAVARMLVACAGDPIAEKKWAMGEAKLAWRRMLKLDPALLRGVAHALGFPKLQSDGSLPMQDFLVWAEKFGNIAESEQTSAKVPNLEGVITLDHEKLARILQEIVRRRIEGLARVEPTDDIRAALRLHAATVEELLSQTRVQRNPVAFDGRLDVLPPCAVRSIEKLGAGVNVPHFGRFALGSLLINIGLSDDEIVPFFQNAPDYNEATTRYQLKTIRDGGYNPPNCDRMEQRGFCPLAGLPREDWPRPCRGASNPAVAFRRAAEKEPAGSSAPSVPA